MKAWFTRPPGFQNAIWDRDFCQIPGKLRFFFIPKIHLGPYEENCVYSMRTLFRDRIARTMSSVDMSVAHVTFTSHRRAERGSYQIVPHLDR